MASTKLLANAFRKVKEEPVEGFAVELADDSNLFDWKIYIEGPTETFYEGGIFQLKMKFPNDFPMSPPSLSFVSDFWHPNVYKDSGAVCISILHAPVVDEMSGELPEERWLPTQTVPTILLSVISLLSSPNFSSPANVDASVEWQREPEKFKKRITNLVNKANREKPSHVVIPHPDSDPAERERNIRRMKIINQTLDDDDLMQDYDQPDSEDSEEEEESEVSVEEEEEEEVKKEEVVEKENIGKSPSAMGGTISKNSSNSSKRLIKDDSNEAAPRSFSAFPVGIVKDIDEDKDKKESEAIGSNPAENLNSNVEIVQPLVAPTTTTVTVAPTVTVASENTTESVGVTHVPKNENNNSGETIQMRNVNGSSTESNTEKPKKKKKKCSIM